MCDCTPENPLSPEELQAIVVAEQTRFEENYRNGRPHFADEFDALFYRAVEYTDEESTIIFGKAIVAALILQNVYRPMVYVADKGWVRT